MPPRQGTIGPREVAIQRAVGGRIRLARGMRALSAEVLAHALGLRTGTVTAWERGERQMTVKQLMRVAAVLRVDPAGLVNGLEGIGLDE